MPTITQLQVTNNALMQLGQSPLASLVDPNQLELATAASLEFDTALDAVLEAHPWNFATFYTTLTTPSTTVPEWGWAHAFTLPQTPFCLRVLQLEDQVPFEVGNLLIATVQTRVLLTDALTANIRWIGRVTNLTLWNGLALAALEKYLAACLAPFVTGQQTRKDALLQEFRGMLPIAQERDGKEGTPHVLAPNRGLVNVRQRGLGVWTGSLT